MDKIKRKNAAREDSSIVVLFCHSLVSKTSLVTRRENGSEELEFFIHGILFPQRENFISERQIRR
jgi:hypothetical protein